MADYYPESQSNWSTSDTAPAINSANDSAVAAGSGSRVVLGHSTWGNTTYAIKSRVKVGQAGVAGGTVQVDLVGEVSDP